MKFLVINTSYFGDTLLTGALCRSIKIQFPDAELIFMANKPFAEAARYLDGVDSVLCYDKKGEHKGFKGMWKFYQQHEQELHGSIEASFVIYGNERGIMLSRMFGAKKVYSDNKHALVRCLLDNGRLDYDDSYNVPAENAALLDLYTGRHIQCLRGRYLVPPEAAEFAAELFAAEHLQPQHTVALCTTTKNPDKDMNPEVCVELIRTLAGRKISVAYVGAGETSRCYAQQLRGRGCTDFVDLTDRTSIPQLAAVLQLAAHVVSVDTGTLHLACAAGARLTGLYYLCEPQFMRKWAPDKCYGATVLTGADITVQNIISDVESSLLKQCCSGGCSDEK